MGLRGDQFKVAEELKRYYKDEVIQKDKGADALPNIPDDAYPCRMKENNRRVSGGGNVLLYSNKYHIEHDQFYTPDACVLHGNGHENCLCLTPAVRNDEGREYSPCVCYYKNVQSSRNVDGKTTSDKCNTFQRLCSYKSDYMSESKERLTLCQGYVRKAPYLFEYKLTDQHLPYLTKEDFVFPYDGQKELYCDDKEEYFDICGCRDITHKQYCQLTYFGDKCADDAVVQFISECNFISKHEPEAKQKYIGHDPLRERCFCQIKLLPFRISNDKIFPSDMWITEANAKRTNMDCACRVLENKDYYDEFSFKSEHGWGYPMWNNKECAIKYDATHSRIDTICTVLNSKLCRSFEREINCGGNVPTCEEIDKQYTAILRANGGKCKKHRRVARSIDSNYSANGTFEYMPKSETLKAFRRGKENIGQLFEGRTDASNDSLVHESMGNLTRKRREAFDLYKIIKQNINANVGQNVQDLIEEVINNEQVYPDSSVVVVKTVEGSNCLTDSCNIEKAAGMILVGIIYLLPVLIMLSCWWSITKCRKMKKSHNYKRLENSDI